MFVYFNCEREVYSKARRIYHILKKEQKTFFFLIKLLRSSQPEILSLTLLNIDLKLRHKGGKTFFFEYLSSSVDAEVAKSTK